MLHFVTDNRKKRSWLHIHKTLWRLHVEVADVLRAHRDATNPAARLTACVIHTASRRYARQGSEYVRRGSSRSCGRCSRGEKLLDTVARAEYRLAEQAPRSLVSKQQNEVHN